MRVRFRDVTEIRKITYKEAILRLSPLTLHFGNRLWGDIVLIKKSKGLNRSLVITPDNAERFIDDVKRHILDEPKWGIGAKSPNIKNHDGA